MNGTEVEVDPRAELESFIRGYRDTVSGNSAIYDEFEKRVNAIPELKAHRDFVDEHVWGYGDRAFYYIWKLLVEQMPQDFKFLEIGVFKGQIISLIALLGRLQNKRPQIVGATPLSTAGDKYSCHEEIDYMAAIQRIYAEFGLETNSTTIIKGLSQTERVQDLCAANGPYDIMFIDGCHDIEVVTSDLLLYPMLLKPSGYLVIDDSSSFVDLPSHLFPGLQEVSIATQEIIEKDPNFEYLFACGHDRVWRKRG